MRAQPFYSIIVVSLNPGDKLKSTLESIKKQTFSEFEVIVKDGFSTDGSLEAARLLSQEWERKEQGRSLKVIQKKDSGIYDAMNQGAEAARGRYVYYLNCGDLFYSENVLQEMADFIKDQDRKSGGHRPGIYYGNIFERLTGGKVASNPRMDAFGCFRNVPCHQACFYSGELLMEHPFETGYKVRADYEQFLWCFFRKGSKEKVNFACKDILVADYEGGGFSETRENKKISAREHREITRRYMTKGELFRFRLIMALSLSGLRTRLAENKKTAGVYNQLKGIFYAHRRK
ncbi:MAG: glycosyltransferase [Lachnospiraceae bacterium]|nr:glycosyltransferase [Lachnospiraceae bacterium]MCI9202718.1 glycosyltransferase [Lachnospiraceae bacterium]MCI9334691.1 glycosyltransferase [Lachnospiraceae bacterium]